jgi:uncharacterized protein (DUF2344 family)
MFTRKQINELLNNNNVIKCSSKSITYGKDFKLLAVKKYYEDGYSPRMIFEESGFSINIIGKKRAKDSLLRWRRIYNKRGEKELVKENRGSSGKRKRLEFKSKDEEIKYLKTKIAYVEAENDFLAKLRGLKE